MYRIAVLTDLKHEGEHYAKVINDYCINQKLFPLLETYQNQEVFFKEIQTHVPDIVLLVLPGVDGLNAAEHLRSLQILAHHPPAQSPYSISSAQCCKIKSSLHFLHLYPLLRLCVFLS